MNFHLPLWFFFPLAQATIKSREALSYGEAQARIDDPKARPRRFLDVPDT